MRPREAQRGQRSRGLQRATADLVALDGFKQGFEVAFAKTFVALALDELEKHRAQLGLREDLQQQPGYL